MSNTIAAIILTKDEEKHILCLIPKRIGISVKQKI